jgi:hypothetical protein
VTDVLLIVVGLGGIYTGWIARGKLDKVRKRFRKADDKA